MELKGFNQFLNENSEFKNIDIEINESESKTDIKETDLDWLSVCKKEFPTETNAILKSINSLKWEAISGNKPMGPGLAIKGVINGFKIPNVDLVAYGGTPFGSKEEPSAAYSVFGLQAKWENGLYKHFFIDCGDEVVPVGAIKIN